MTGEGPFERARAKWLDAKATAERNPSAANLKAQQEALSALDFVLDTLPLVGQTAPPLVSPLLPPSPTGPGASSPGPVVPFFVVGGEHGEEELLDELLGEGDDDA